MRKCHRASLMSIFTLVVVIGLSAIAAYWMFSDRALVEAMLTADEQYYTTDAQRQSADRVHEAMELALDSPGIGLVVALAAVRSTSASLICFLLLVWLTISLFSGRWNLGPQFIHVVSTSGGILILGVIFNTLLRVGLQRMTAMFSPVFFIRPYWNTNFFHYLTIHLELFTVWYMVTISIGLAIIYKQKFIEILFIVLGIFYMMTLLGFISGYEFALT
jgi:hypothetical protein